MKGNSRMRRLLALALVVALISIGVPTSSFAGPRVNSSVAGIAKDTTGRPLANTTVRMRNVMTGQIAGTARTSLSGAFTFENLTSGNYIVETVNAAGRIVATSSSLDVAPGMAMTGVAVTAPADVAAAAQPGAAAVVGASFFSSGAGMLVLTAIGTGTVAGLYYATKGDGSASK
jgi:hypothetical protein